MGRGGGGGGGGREIWRGGLVVIICAYEEGLEQLGRVTLAAFVISLMSVGGSRAETRMYSPEISGKVPPQGIQQHALFTHDKYKLF